MRPADDGGPVGGYPYQIVGQQTTWKVNANNTTTQIEQITARSLTYDVSFTFNMTMASYLADGAPAETALRTEQVDALAGHEHVIGVRGEEDQGNDGNLYNYLVLTVGTDDGDRSQEVRIRMDSLGVPSAFAAVDAAWHRIQALGP